MEENFDNVFIENEQTELKKSTSLINEALISIVSILNKHRKGQLFFGVKNNGEIIGQAITEKTLRKVSQAIANHIEPRIFPIIEKLRIKEKDIIKVSFSSNEEPFFAFGRAYIRVADEDRQLNANELKIIIIRGEIYQNFWDSELCNLTSKSINQNTLYSFIKKAKLTGRLPDIDNDQDKIIEKLNLAKDGKLSHAAKYLFTSEHSVEIQTAIFAGTDKLTFLDIKKHNMPLLDLLVNTEKYINEKMNWRVEFIDFKRVEIPEIPTKAIREALVNSLIHRDFNNPKGNEVAIYKNRIEIYNPGTFPADLTPEDYIQGKAHSYLRNPLISEIFYLTKDVEKWGSGLMRIYNECNTAGIKVKFEVTNTGFTTVFYRDSIFNSQIEKKINNSDSEKNNFGTISERFRNDFGSDVIKILKYIDETPTITAKELGTKMKKSPRTIENHIKKLKDKGVLYRIGPNLGGHWKIITNEKKLNNEK